jgi:hypothetical protein
MFRQQRRPARTPRSLDPYIVLLLANLAHQVSELPVKPPVTLAVMAGAWAALQCTVAGSCARHSGSGAHPRLSARPPRTAPPSKPLHQQLNILFLQQRWARMGPAAPRGAGHAVLPSREAHRNDAVRLVPFRGSLLPSLAANLGLFFARDELPVDLVPSVWDACLQPRLVLQGRQWKRLLSSGFLHADAVSQSL